MKLIIIQSDAYSKILISPTSKKKWKSRKSEQQQPVQQRPLPQDYLGCFRVTTFESSLSNRKMNHLISLFDFETLEKTLVILF